MTIFVADQGQLTLLLHTPVNFHCQVDLVLFFDALNILPSLVLDVLAIFLVSLDHLLDFLRQSLLLSFEIFALDDLVAVKLFHQLFMGQVCLTHQHFKLLQVVLLLLSKLVVAVLVRLPLLSLVARLCFKRIAMLVHAVVDLFLIASLHIARLLLNLLHRLASLELFLLHLAGQVLSLLLVLEHECGLFLLSVTVLSLDRLLQVTNLLLKLISLFLLNKDLLRDTRKLTLLFAFVIDVEDGEGSISACREQELVIVAGSDTGDLLGVRLDLKDLVFFEGVHDYLH